MNKEKKRPGSTKPLRGMGRPTVQASPSQPGAPCPRSTSVLQQRSQICLLPALQVPQGHLDTQEAFDKCWLSKQINERARRDGERERGKMTLIWCPPRLIYKFLIKFSPLIQVSTSYSKISFNLNPINSRLVIPDSLILHKCDFTKRKTGTNVHFQYKFYFNPKCSWEILFIQKC